METRQEQYKQLIELVKTEADNLLKHASKLELSRLNFRNLNASSIGNCIYGQMTGDCYCSRAQDLVERCATRVYNTGKERAIAANNINNLNGEPRPVLQRNASYHSPIEVFVLFNSYKPLLVGNNNLLVDYLKGETTTFEPFEL